MERSSLNRREKYLLSTAEVGRGTVPIWAEVFDEGKFPPPSMVLINVLFFGKTFFSETEPPDCPSIAVFTLFLLSFLVVNLAVVEF